MNGSHQRRGRRWSYGGVGSTRHSRASLAGRIGLLVLVAGSVALTGTGLELLNDLEVAWLYLGRGGTPHFDRGGCGVVRARGFSGQHVKQSYSNTLGCRANSRRRLTARQQVGALLSACRPHSGHLIVADLRRAEPDPDDSLARRLLRLSRRTYWIGERPLTVDRMREWRDDVLEPSAPNPLLKYVVGLPASAITDVVNNTEAV